MREGEELPLDDEQRAAVEAGERTIAVLAGPGSGKTRTLSYRAHHLLQRDRESRALLLTFTNKAAAEMKSRALRVGALASDRIQASTFHGFGARMLRNHGDLVGISRDFDFLDQEAQEQLAATVAGRLGTSSRLSRWSYLRVRRFDIEERLVAFATAFEQAKREASLVDYDDLVVYTAQLLEDHPQVAHAYGAQYRHLLVDEFQDTNAAQFAIVRTLSLCVDTVSVFADDDQAIFRFAGADVGNIRSFVNALEARVYPLTCNYRSRKAIVRVANKLISADENASGRRMRADKSGGDVALLVFDSMESESRELCDEMGALVDDSGVRPSDIAVLVRSGYRADLIVRELQRRELPLSDWRGPTYEPRERQTMATCIAVLRGQLNDRQAIRLSELLGVEVIEERDTHQFLSRHEEHPGASQLLVVREMAFSGESPSKIAERVQDAVSAVDEARARALQPLVDAVGHFQTHNAEFTLDDLLAELALGSGGRPPTEGGGIKVASLHRTKGLQWPRVYLVGLEEGHLPDYREEDNPEDEERRLCFVGVCRSEDVLRLTFAREFRGYRRRPSRFLKEVELAE